MGLQKPVKRHELTKAINDTNLPLDKFFVSAVRATLDGQLQIEVAQKRILEGKSINVLAALNKGDDRYGNAATMLFNWMGMTPKGFQDMFPTANVTLAELESIAKTWKEDAPNGPDAIVYPLLQTFKNIVVEGKEFQPVINVTEVPADEIEDFYTESSKRRDENISNALDKEYRVMKTPPNEKGDQDYIVDATTGEKIFRFTRTNVVGDPRATDKMVPTKVSMKVYESRLAKSEAGKSTSTIEPENILVGGDSLP